MTINDVEAARLAASNYFMSEGFGAGISIDLAHRYTDEGGKALLTGGVPLLTMPSGRGIRGWLEALKVDPSAQHLFSPPVAPTPTIQIVKAALIDKTETADSKLSRANGHSPMRPTRKGGTA